VAHAVETVAGLPLISRLISLSAATSGANDQGQLDSRLIGGEPGISD